MILRVLAAALLAAVPILASVSPAAACTCANWTDTQKLENADAAFIGHVVSTSESRVLDPDGRGPYTELTHIFEVQTVVKGQFEQLTEVVAGQHSGVCGLPGVVTSGARSGILIYVTDDGVNRSGLCSIVDADELLAIAGNSGYPPLPVSNQNILGIVEPETPSEVELAPARLPGEASDSDDPGTIISLPLILGVFAALVVGYALWLITLANRRSRT